MAISALHLLFGVSMSACAFAQFSSLSTTKDGSVLYFATQLKEKNTAEPTYGKIFRIDSAGLHLLYSRDITDRDKPCSNAHNLTDISASSDGSVLALGGQCSCLSGNRIDQYNCVKIDHYTTTIASGGKSQDYPGEFWLSRNGKLALNRRGANIEFSPYSCYVIDLGTGETKASYGIALSQSFLLRDSVATATGRILADNGTAVLTDGNPGIGLSNDRSITPTGGELLILAGGTIQQFPRPSTEIWFADATIDAGGQTVLFTEHNSITNRNSLRITRPGATSTDLFVADGYLPSLTDDGRQVLYLSGRTGTPQAYLIGIDGKGDRALTAEPDGLAEAILSGDGTVAYALTLGGRLLKISVSSGKAQELVPRTPFLDLAFPSPTPYLHSWPLVLAPGKRALLSGGGLLSGSFSAAPPFPQSLGGVSVSIQGRPAPILSVEPSRIGLLVPADAATDNVRAPIHVETTSPSPFESSLDADTGIYDAAPESVATVHEDWSALVSGDKPARPGEILHTYAFGLGPTTPAVPFGAAAPATEPLARLSTQPVCVDDTNSFSSAKPPVEVLFAGLAPGMVAVYQVDWRVPATAGADDHFSLRCSNWGATVPIAFGK